MTTASGTHGHLHRPNISMFSRKGKPKKSLRSEEQPLSLPQLDTTDDDNDEDDGLLSSSMQQSAPLSPQSSTSYQGDVDLEIGRNRSYTDEEDDDDDDIYYTSFLHDDKDPYVYSDDDVGSLSDAYFFPQSDRPPRSGGLPQLYHNVPAPYSYNQCVQASSPNSNPSTPPNRNNDENNDTENEALVYSEDDSLSMSAQNKLKIFGSYGSLTFSQDSPTIATNSDRASLSTLSLSGTTILEHSPSTPQYTILGVPHQGQYRPKPLRNQYRRTMHQHKRMLKQKEQQFAREQAVRKIRGKPQVSGECHDGIYAVLFIFQLILVLLCAIWHGHGLTQPTLFSSGVSSQNWNVTATSHPSILQALKNEMSHNTTTITTFDHSNLTSMAPTPLQVVASFSIDYQNVITVFCVSGIYACVLSYLSFGFMLIIARSLIQITLISSVLLALLWGLCGMALLDPYEVITIMGCSAFLLASGYTVYNWNSIPFAATNLNTALCAMRCTADIILLGMGTLVVAFLWCLIWSVALIGLVNAGNSDECLEDDKCDLHMVTRNIPSYILLLISFFWTNMVIKNIVRVTVASAIGTWWFTPGEIRPCCSNAVGRPLAQSFTTSLGSICMGSLVLYPAQALAVFFKIACWLLSADDYEETVATRPRSNSNNSHANGVAGSGGGTATTILSPAEQASFERHETETDVLNRLSRNLRCCNRWSYTYIGMYGYSFAEGGEKAVQLFETREWMDVVRDNLIQNVLLMASLVIGGSTGTFAVLLEEVDGYTFTTLHKPIITAFVTGSILGFVLSNILLLGLVGSAVDATLVCFAAGPFEFDKNHPRLSREMRDVWSQQVWEPSGGDG